MGKFCGLLRGSKALLIRLETAADIQSIHELTRVAFAPMVFSDGSEPAIIDALRDHGDLTLSLVAQDSLGEIVGQITLSPVSINGQHDDWFGLGPVAVLPEKQGQGIGARLIKAAIEFLETCGANGCALVGNPDYYARFGFKNKSGLRYGDMDVAYVQQLGLAGPLKSGELKFSKAFGD